MKVFAHRKQTSTVLNDAQWPDQFVFPVQKVPATLTAALDKGTDLCNPKQRYLHGQLLQILCNEAVKLTSHPDHYLKIKMAKSIVTAMAAFKRAYRSWIQWLAGFNCRLSEVYQASIGSY